MKLLILAIILVASVASVQYFYGNENIIINPINFTPNDTYDYYVDCSFPGLSIDYINLNFTTKKANVLITSSGWSDDKIVNAILTGKGDAELLTPVNFFIKKGEQKELIFDIDGYVDSCSDFKQLRISSQCVTKNYEFTPHSCRTINGSA